MKKPEDLARRIKRTRKQLGLNGLSQQDLLKRVRAAFELTNEEMSVALGVSLNTLLAYLAPEAAGKYRRMPEADLLVLARILSELRKGK